MAYKVINEELKIASCRIADLTFEQVSAILKSWGDDTPIGDLVVFFDKNSEYLVINEDAENFQMYLNVVEGYMKADIERRKEIRRQCPKSLLSTLKVIDVFKENQLIETWIKRSSSTCINNFERLMISRIGGPCPEFTAYRLGVMRGKRIERAKKRKAGAMI